MDGIAALKASLKTTGDTLVWFLDGFTDADMLVRPVPGANHAAWQVGNVIAGDSMIVRSQMPDAVFPELPKGFAALHGTEGAKQAGTEGFLTKADYLDLFTRTRAATIAALETLTDADLDRASMGEYAHWIPTFGLMFLMTANHTLMHAGQFSVIRRALGKPHLF